MCQANGFCKCLPRNYITTIYFLFFFQWRCDLCGLSIHGRSPTVRTMSCSRVHGAREYRRQVNSPSSVWPIQSTRHEQRLAQSFVLWSQLCQKSPVPPNAKRKWTASHRSPNWFCPLARSTRAMRPHFWADRRMSLCRCDCHSAHVPLTDG